MGIVFFMVAFRKHVEVSGDLVTIGSVCPFLENMNSNQLPVAFCHLIYN